MYNVRALISPSGEVSLTFITDKPQLNSAPSKVKRPLLPTPFTDEDGNILYGREDEFSGMTDEQIAQLKAFRASEVIRCATSRARATIRDLAYCAEWKYFATFTFSPEFDRYNYDVCLKYMCDFLNSLKRRLHHNFDYIVVPELHQDGAYHFHGLFSADISQFLSYAGEFCLHGRKQSDGSYIYTGPKESVYHCSLWKFGFTSFTIVRDSSKCASYISSYITKDFVAVSPGRKRYLRSRTLKKKKLSCI